MNQQDKTVWDTRCESEDSVHITERIPTKELIVTPKGETVIDFGQIITRLAEVLGKSCDAETYKKLYDEKPMSELTATAPEAKPMYEAVLESLNQKE